MTDEAEREPVWSGWTGALDCPWATSGAAHPSGTWRGWGSDHEHFVWGDKRSQWQADASAASASLMLEMFVRFVRMNPDIAADDPVIARVWAAYQATVPTTKEGQ